MGFWYTAMDYGAVMTNWYYVHGRIGVTDPLSAAARHADSDPAPENRRVVSLLCEEQAPRDHVGNDMLVGHQEQLPSSFFIVDNESRTDVRFAVGADRFNAHSCEQDLFCKGGLLHETDSVCDLVQSTIHDGKNVLLPRAAAGILSAVSPSLALQTPFIWVTIPRPVTRFMFMPPGDRYGQLDKQAQGTVRAHTRGVRPAVAQVRRMVGGARHQADVGDG